MNEEYFLLLQFFSDVIVRIMSPTIILTVIYFINCRKTVKKKKCPPHVPRAHSPQITCFDWSNSFSPAYMQFTMI